MAAARWPPVTLVADDPATPADETAYATPRGTCTVNVGFKPTRSGYQSVARLQVTSGSDAATESIPLTGLSTNSSLGSVGGNVASMLSLTLGSTPSFGSFVPAVARTYDAAGAATVVSTAGDAALSVSDADAVNPGKLVNGTFALRVGGHRPRDQRGADRPAYIAVGAAPDDAAQLRGADARCRSRHAQLPSGDRRHRPAARGQLQQDAHVHAEHHHSVVN